MINIGLALEQEGFAIYRKLPDGDVIYKDIDGYRAVIGRFQFVLRYDIGNTKMIAVTVPVEQVDAYTFMQTLRYVRGINLNCPVLKLGWSER